MKITNRHRVFSVNGKIEFALFYNALEDHEVALQSFLVSNLWKGYLRETGEKYHSAAFADERTVNIKTTT